MIDPGGIRIGISQGNIQVVNVVDGDGQGNVDIPIVLVLRYGKCFGNDPFVLVLLL